MKTQQPASRIIRSIISPVYPRSICDGAKLSRHLPENFTGLLPPIICVGLRPHAYNPLLPYDRQHQPPACYHQPSVHHCRYYPNSSPARNLHLSRALHLDIVEQHRKCTGLPAAAADPHTPALQHWRRPLPGAIQEQVPAETPIGYMFDQCRALRHHR